jgi:hypothetical protein
VLDANARGVLQTRAITLEMVTLEMSPLRDVSANARDGKTRGKTRDVSGNARDVSTLTL